ncbi:cilium assembly [Branchiostoma belcheri]|nr:cilium assembly [Branchiostoma belcheri]
MSDESSEFTEDDIRRQLAALGYHDVPDYRLKQFARDLRELVQHDRSKASSQEQSFASSTSRVWTPLSPPSQPSFYDSQHGPILHIYMDQIDMTQ